MRKKRKLRARAEAQAAALADLQRPEVQEALAAEAAFAEHQREAVRLAREAARAEAEAQAAEPASAGAADETDVETGDGAGDAPLTHERLMSVIESFLFASDKALTLADIHKLIGKRSVERVRVQEAMEALVQAHADTGIVIHCIGGAYQLRTHPANSSLVQRLVAGKPVRLSRAQLETLAICAYRQPITRPEIDEIRGVDSGNTLRMLLDRSLIRILGKKEEPGRPLLYGTTKEFLEFFNLGDLSNLPTLREYSELSEDSIEEARRLGHSLDDVASARGIVSDDDGEGGSSSGDAGGDGGGPAAGDDSGAGTEHAAASGTDAAAADGALSTGGSDAAAEDGAPAATDPEQGAPEPVLAEGSRAHAVPPEPVIHPAAEAPVTGEAALPLAAGPDEAGRGADGDERADS